MRRQSKNKMTNKRQRLPTLLRPDFPLFNCSSIVLVIYEWFFENKKIDKVPLASLQKQSKVGKHSIYTVELSWWYNHSATENFKLFQERRSWGTVYRNNACKLNYLMEWSLFIHCFFSSLCYMRIRDLQNVVRRIIII